MTLNEIAAAWNEDEIEYVLIEEGEWVNEGKRQHCTSVIKYEDKYYEMTSTRYGSYYSDYEYMAPECIEVTPVKEMVEVTTWKVVK